MSGPAVALVLALAIFHSQPPAQAATNEYLCGAQPPYPRILEPRGRLVVPRNVSTCGFMTKDNTAGLSLDLADLKLQAGDSLQVSSDQDKSHQFVLSPPFDAALFLSGTLEPKLLFTFAKLDNTTVTVDYELAISKVAVNADLNNDIQIKTFQVPDLVVTVNKTINDTIHLHVIGADLPGTKLRQTLLDKPTQTVRIVNIGDATVHLKTSPVQANCSSVSNNTAEFTKSLSLPTSAGPRRCVNLFNGTSTPSLRFELDLTKFTQMSPARESLIVFDSANVLMAPTDLSPYLGHRINLQTSELAIVYESRKGSTQASERQITVVGLQSAPIVTNSNYIASAGYPTSYIVSKQNDSTLVSPKGFVVLSLMDLDLRAGESLLYGQTVLNTSWARSNDIIMSNKMSANITLRRAADKIRDFEFHRGFNMSVQAFSKYLQANVKPGSPGSVLTDKGSSSTLIQISSTGQPQFICYTVKLAAGENVTSADLSKFGRLQLTDGQSLRLVNQSQIEAANSTGEEHIATSNNVLIAYKWLAPANGNTSSPAPQLNIVYNSTACNQTAGDIVCDYKTRCVPARLLCSGAGYCKDGSDLRVRCRAGPTPQPQIIETGLQGLTVFFLSVLMLTLGACSALYGPSLFRALDSRVRAGQYSTFSSME